MTAPRPAPMFEMAMHTIAQQLRSRTLDAAGDDPAPSHVHLEDYAQILQGELRLQEGPVDLPALLTHAWQSQADEAAAKGLRYTCHGLAQMPARVLADGQRLQHIVGNLLSNALRFTASGRVELHTHWHSEQPPEGVLYLYVVDTGAGMSTRTKDKLFNPFDHVLTQLNRQHRGQTGFARHLGLVVTAGIVRAWRGQIEVRSALGTGSTFMVELPMTELHASGV